MAASLFILVFCGLMAWLLLRYGARNVSGPSGALKLGLFLAVLTLFVLAGALMAWEGRASLLRAVNEPPVVSEGSLWDLASGEGVILAGVVSSQNRLMQWDAVAYVDESHLWSPTELRIDLDEGGVSIGNDTYRPVAWPRGTMGTVVLKAGQPVVVVGALERMTGMLGESRGKTFLSVRADVVFAGSHEEFVNRAARKAVLAGGVLAANLAGAAIILVLGSVTVVRRARAASPASLQ